MRLDLLRDEFAIARLDGATCVPDWARSEEPAEFLSITRTCDELSIVCESARVPTGIAAERGWRCVKVEGPLDFSLVGVLAALAEPLSRAGVPIFAISTFDTDYVMLKAMNLETAIAALESAGHVIVKLQ
jgi:uncharacterized protein